MHKLGKIGILNTTIIYFIAAVNQEHQYFKMQQLKMYYATKKYRLFS